ncbi:hypothetical protein [Streptomyces sp. NPDC088180]|uniref:hypothetical protein n=1 Tax=Streptomyces sp. NPDC088180 TaxID=3365837 RepID=UPI003823A5FB
MTTRARLGRLAVVAALAAGSTVAIGGHAPGAHATVRVIQDDQNGIAVIGEEGDGESFGSAGAFGDGHKHNAVPFKNGGVSASSSVSFP